MWYLSLDKSSLVRTEGEMSSDLYEEVTDEEAAEWLEKVSPTPEPPPPAPPVYSNETLTAALIELTKDL